ncbi:hypothetical protein, partial [Geobacillus sp. DSP4a]|uniref:hypothetical protein n=1 Tax=Geobacillus sp. DSP4a TaxID=2508873 RepID=UPI001C0EF269
MNRQPMGSRAKPEQAADKEGADPKVRQKADFWSQPSLVFVYFTKRNKIPTLFSPSFTPPRT